MPIEGNTKEPSNIVEIQNPTFEENRAEEGSPSLASDSARSSSTAPSNVVEARNPAFENRAEDDGSPSLASGSVASSITAVSSATRQTCPNCEKALEILPGRSGQIPTDLCRCKTLPATPPPDAESYEPAVAVDDTQEVPEVPPSGEDSRPSDSFPSDSIGIAADLSTDVSRQEPANETQPVAARQVREHCCQKDIGSLCCYTCLGIAICLIIFVIIYLAFFKSSGETNVPRGQKK